MDYSGDMVVKAVPLTVAQLQTTLPGIGVGGSIDILSVMSPGIRRFLLHPELSLLAPEG